MVLSEVAGVSTFAVHLPASTGVSVECEAGAGTVSIYEASHSGVSAGSTFSGGPTGHDSYLIRAQGGASAITVDTAG